MRAGVRSVLAALVAAALLAPRAARADAKACITLSEQAQQARSDGHLRAARELFDACARPECPAAVRVDCEKSFDDVTRSLPSIVLSIRIGGRDVVGARALIDGNPVPNALEGRAFFVDPGPRDVRVESKDGVVLGDQPIVAHEGEKNRLIAFDLAPAGPPAARPPAPQAVPPAQPDRPEHAARRHTAWPWVVFGVGAATALAGGIAIVAAGGNQPFTNGLNDGEIVGLALVGGGAAILTVGLIWHFAEPTKPQRVSIAPLIAPHLAGLGVSFRL
jgi:hypothetical protein